MTDPHDAYENPLAERYASRAMTGIFSRRFRFATWRRLWLALAESEAELGLPITEAQLAALRGTLEDLDFARADALEAELRHDVMAHVHAWREVCPEGGRILHLGATSCFVTDNAELVQMRAGLALLVRKLAALVRHLRSFALRWRDLPTVGYTHFQPAQFTTVGKRATLWLQDFLMDLIELERVTSTLRFRGVKGTTGTQDSFLKLFDGDGEKVQALDRLVAERMGFERRFAVTGQTYPRKQDTQVVHAVAGIAESAGRFSSDLRLLCHLREIEEPFGSRQVGSSAMAYKRNPMRSERIAALSRWLLTIALNPPLTASTQWFERTLDDSANRRLALSGAFLTADAILELLLNVVSGLEVKEAVIARHVGDQLPFIASEEILMAAVKDGGDRQELHELIRQASVEAQERLKAGDGVNDFLERLRRQAALAGAVTRVEARLDPIRFTGRASDQVGRFMTDEVDPVLALHPEDPLEDEVRV